MNRKFLAILFIVFALMVVGASYGLGVLRNAYFNPSDTEDSPSSEVTTYPTIHPSAPATEIPGT